jgi:hypothetical protein
MYLDVDLYEYWSLAILHLNQMYIQNVWGSFFKKLYDSNLQHEVEVIIIQKSLIKFDYISHMDFFFKHKIVPYYRLFLKP